ncbi:hypothetical protein [Oceanobacillus arenosus]|uniref:hypothetical protein n=1 Tax=Oceanobacillus arenosus TaxID=1229153 RepID=UPI001B86A2F3|nr:hypothetical protein [Oceanobacillus arenosus]
MLFDYLLITYCINRVELATRELSIKLLQENAPIELIAKATDFSVEEVEEIKRSL